MMPVSYTHLDVYKRQGQGTPEEAPGARSMSRSKKWRLEWAFFLGENGRRKFNEVCKGCVYRCV